MSLIAQRFAAASLLLAASAFAAPRDPQSFNNVDSNGPDNSATNQIRAFTVTDSYLAYKIDFSGNLTKVNTATFASEARLRITPPVSFGAPFTLQPFTTTSFTGTIPFTRTVDFPLGANPQGNWSIRFFESTDDGGTASVDSTWTPFNLVFDDSPPPPQPPPVGAIDLGDVAVGTNISTTRPLASGQIIWFRINLTQAISATGSPVTFLDMYTLGSALLIGTSAGTDTVFGIYVAPSGARVAFDDDDGPGLTSQMSFGGGRRVPNFATVDGAASEGLTLAGQDGANLAANEYYVAVTAFSSTFNATLYSVTTTHTRTGTIAFNLRCAALPCGPADFNSDGTADFFDYLDFVAAFDAGCP